MILTKRWMILATSALIPVAFWAVWPAARLLTNAWIALLLATTLADYLLLPALERISIRRITENPLSLRAKSTVRLELENADAHAWSIVIHDEPPSGWETDWQDQTVTVAGRARAILTYQVEARERGDAEYGDLWMRILGRLGLVAVQVRTPAAEKVQVYPDILEAAKFNLLAQRGRLVQVGVRTRRMPGQGQEFESLREYLQGDEYRKIDWKATARRGKLITRQYQTERSQNVIIMLDAGRSMLAEIDGVTKIDHALRAALVLANVAAQADDRVGLLVFADTVQQWIPPRKGRSQVQLIVKSLYNVAAKRSEPDYQGAFAYLQARWQRRSLVICFTDLWDPDSAKEITKELARLQKRHLTACVALLDTNVLRMSEMPLTNVLEVYEQATALQVLDDRALATAALRQRGVLVIDSPADRLSADLVNRYLEVKQKALL
jgi:uncharacterized protein (DUF58 family)